MEKKTPAKGRRGGALKTCHTPVRYCAIKMERGKAMQADHYSINSNLCSQLEYPWTEMENPAEANQFKGFNQAEEVPIRTTRTLSNAGRSAKNLRFIDLFAGIGGFRLALESPCFPGRCLRLPAGSQIVEKGVARSSFILEKWKE